MKIEIKKILTEDLNFFDTATAQPVVDKAYIDSTNYINKLPEVEKANVINSLEQGNQNLGIGKDSRYDRVKIGPFLEDPINHARRLQSLETEANIQNYANSLANQPTSIISDNTKHNLQLLGAGGIGAGLAFGLANRFKNRR